MRFRKFQHLSLCIGYYLQLSWSQQQYAELQKPVHWRIIECRIPIGGGGGSGGQVLAGVVVVDGHWLAWVLNRRHTSLMSVTRKTTLLCLFFSFTNYSSSAAAIYHSSLHIWPVQLHGQHWPDSSEESSSSSWPTPVSHTRTIASAVCLWKVYLCEIPHSTVNK